MGELAHSEWLATGRESPPPQSAPRLLPAVTLGQRIAGGLLFLPVAWAVGISVFAPSLSQRLVVIVVGGVISSVLGLLILLGKRSWVKVTIAWVSIGLLGVFSGDALFAFVALLASLGLLALLVGRASLLRIAFAGLLIVTAWLSPLAFTLLGFDRWLSDREVRISDIGGSIDRLHGARLGYSLSLPRDGWHELRSQSRARLAPGTDAIAVNIETGAHVRAWVARKEDALWSLNGYESNLRDKIGLGVSVPEGADFIPRYPDRSRVLAVLGDGHDNPWKGYRALVVGAGWHLQVQVSVSSEAFAGAEAELRGIVDSVQVADAELKPPKDLIDRSVAAVAWGSVAPVGAGWYLVDKSASESLGLPADGVAFRRPYREMLFSAWSEEVDEEQTPEALADLWLESWRDAGATIDEVSPRDKPREDMVIAELAFERDGTSQEVWLAVTRRGTTAAFGLVEVPVGSRARAKPDALASLKTLRLPAVSNE